MNDERLYIQTMQECGIVMIICAGDSQIFNGENFDARPTYKDGIRKYHVVIDDGSYDWMEGERREFYEKQGRRLLDEDRIGWMYGLTLDIDWVKEHCIKPENLWTIPLQDIDENLCTWNHSVDCFKTTFIGDPDKVVNLARTMMDLFFEGYIDLTITHEQVNAYLSLIETIKD